MHWLLAIAAGARLPIPFPPHRCGQIFSRVLFGFHTGSWGVGPRRWCRHMYSFFIIPTWPFSTPYFGSVLIIASLSRVLAPRGARRLCAVLALDGYLVMYWVFFFFVPVSFLMALHRGGCVAVLVGSSEEAGRHFPDEGVVR